MDNRIGLVVVGAIGVLILGYALWVGAPEPVSPTPSTESKMSYAVPELGISLLFPDTYTYIVSADTYNEKDMRVVSFLKKEDFEHVPQQSEYPPGITLVIVERADEKTLEQWVRTEQLSNFELSQNKILTATTVGGKLAYEYSFSGLYENDAIAVAHNGRVYLFFAAWNTAGDATRADMQAMVQSVTFI